MAISFQAHAQGAKTSISGTTFTISLTSTAGDLICVAVAISATGTTVSGVTDTGGNTYHQIGTTTTTGIRTALWKTDAVNALAAGGTVTVTLSASGSTAAGAAATYRGVACTTIVATTASGNSAAPSTASTALQETHGWVVTAMGAVGTGGFTATSGSMRDQSTNTTNTVEAAIFDSNAGASPVTNAASITSARWAVVSMQLRLLESTRLDTMAQTEVWRIGYGQKFAESTLNNWLDSGSLSIQYTSAFAESTLNNWLDSRAQILGFTLSPSETTLNNWLDSESIGYGILPSDQDTMWLDNEAATLFPTPLSISPSDQDTTWLDATQLEYDYLLGLTDDLNNYLDAAAVEYDSLLALSDDLDSWSDVGQLAYDYLLESADDLNNWSDSEADILVQWLALNDQDTTWLDGSNFGYGLQISDQDTTWLDANHLTADSPQALGDDLNNWWDSSNLGYGLAIGDQGSTWLDTAIAKCDFLLVLADDLDNWMGSGSAGFQDYLVGLLDDLNNWSDSSSFDLEAVDNPPLLELAVSDQMTQADALTIQDAREYQVIRESVTQASPNVRDYQVLRESVLQVNPATREYQVIRESIIQYYPPVTETFSDQLVLADATAWALGSRESFSDQLVISDALNVALLTPEAFADQMAMADSLGMVLLAGDTILVNLSDQMAVALDVVGATLYSDNGVNIIETPADQMVMGDALSIGLGIIQVTGYTTVEDNSLTNSSANIAFNVVPGQFIAVAISLQGSEELGSEPIGATDNGGNVYTQIAYSITGLDPYINVVVYGTIAYNAATQITASWEAGAPVAVNIISFSGVTAWGNRGDSAFATTSFFNDTSAHSPESITGSVFYENNALLGVLSHPSLGGAPTATSGNIIVTSAGSAGNDYTSAMINTGSLSPTCSNSYGAGVGNVACAIELVAVGNNAWRQYGISTTINGPATLPLRTTVGSLLVAIVHWGIYDTGASPVISLSTPGIIWSYVGTISSTSTWNPGDPGSFGHTLHTGGVSIFMCTNFVSSASLTTSLTITFGYSAHTMVVEFITKNQNILTVRTGSYSGGEFSGVVTPATAGQIVSVSNDIIFEAISYAATDGLAPPTNTSEGFILHEFGQYLLVSPGGLIDTAFQNISRTQYYVQYGVIAVEFGQVIIGPMGQQQPRIFISS